MVLTNGHRKTVQLANHGGLAR